MYFIISFQLNLFVCFRLRISFSLFLLPTVRRFVNNNNNNNNNDDDDDDDLEVAHPQSGSSSTWFLVELEFGNVVVVVFFFFFEERGKPEYPEKNLSEQRRETKNKFNPHMASTPEFEPGPHW